MAKADHKRLLKHLYSASRNKPVVVDVPEMSFLMIDGRGDPQASQHFQNAVAALYAVSYALKFMLKNADPPLDFVVMPLEGLWWTEGAGEFRFDDRDQWRWTLMVMQPEPVTAGLFARAVEQVARKKDLPALSEVRFESLHEGLSAQMLHVGPYSAEQATISTLHEFVREQGRRLRGRHHEIYLSDPRRTAPERLKTILRHPIQ
ncbi:MAG: GyrI-like domain-containing protein [Armatimonadota bacterium]